MITVMD